MVCGSTRLQQMVRVRRVVPTAKCSVRDRPNASGHGYTSTLKKYYKVKRDSKIYGGAAATYLLVPQSAELERQSRTEWSVRSVSRGRGVHVIHFCGVVSCLCQVLWDAGGVQH